MPSAIERIRARVDEIREEHVLRAPDGHLCMSDKCNAGVSWPCDTLKLSEDLLTLAEALQKIGHCYVFTTEIESTANEALAKVGGSDEG